MAKVDFIRFHRRLVLGPTIHGDLHRSRLHRDSRPLPDAHEQTGDLRPTPLGFLAIMKSILAVQTSYAEVNRATDRAFGK